MGISGERINYNIDTRTYVQYNNSRIATWSYYILVEQSQSILSRYWRWKLTLELEECIKDAFDASLEEYMKSKDYISERQRTTEKLKNFRAGLSDIQQQQFNEIIYAISDDNSKLASEAYMHGVVEGIALRGKVIG